VFVADDQPEVTKVVVFSTLSSFYGIEDQARELGAHLVVDKYTSPRSLMKAVLKLMQDR
jgi:hypothetical protein